MFKEIIFLLGAVLSLSYAHPVDKFNIAIIPQPIPQSIQQPIQQNPFKEILIPAQTMFRKGNWKSGVGLGNYGSATGYAGLGGYQGYGGYTGYSGYGGYQQQQQPGYGWRTG